MSMTPGPWWVSELNASGNVSEYYIFIEPGIAVIERAIKGQDQHDMPNARAIAALPEILDVLIWAMAWVPRPTPMSAFDTEAYKEHRRMYEYARAALNKAGVTHD